jgi:hypothetical protein
MKCNGFAQNILNVSNLHMPIPFFDILKKYTIYVHCWKIYNLFVQALEMGINASLW